MRNVRANPVADYESCKNPGDFFFAGGDARIHFLCPCGCGDLAGISLKPKVPSGWDWNGNREKPTCTPSILINRGHWHGYLTDGEFREC